MFKGEFQPPWPPEQRQMPAPAGWEAPGSPSLSAKGSSHVGVGSERCGVRAFPVQTNTSACLGGLWRGLEGPALSALNLRGHVFTVIICTDVTHTLSHVSHVTVKSEM